MVSFKPSPDVNFISQRQFQSEGYSLTTLPERIKIGEQKILAPLIDNNLSARFLPIESLIYSRPNMASQDEEGWSGTSSVAWATICSRSSISCSGGWYFNDHLPHSKRSVNHCVSARFVLQEGGIAKLVFGSVCVVFKHQSRI